MQKKSLIALALSTTTAFALVACSDDTTATDGAATEATVSNEATTVTETAPAQSDETATSSAEDSTTSPAPAGEDLSFAAIDAVLAEHSDGIIVDVDREDDSDVYDIDVVTGGEVIELEVNATTGEIREDEREGDDDDVQKANAATKTAAEAIREALDAHPDGVLDSADLDEDDGRLTWEIELDDADRNDLAELEIAAN